jgi:ABC-type xylose transport system permease subunit
LSRRQGSFGGNNDDRIAAAEPKRGAGFLQFVSGATGPLIGLILLCVFLSFTTDTFLSSRNFLNVMDQITVLGVMAVGMTVVILIGGIDLSVGSVLALSAMVMGYLGNYQHWPFVVAIVAALVVSGVCGLVSGLMVSRLHMPAFIATLAMMSIARGIASIITNGEQIVGFPDWFSSLAIIRNFGFLTVTVGLMIASSSLPGWSCNSGPPAARSTRSAAAQKSRGSRASMFEPRRSGSTRSTRVSQVLRASSSRPASIRPSPVPASATNSTRSPRW